ncbi:MAG TPA: cytochrome D ubiquinol oxidase subunit I, partial [Bradyrhizobium sp.]
MNEIIRNTQAAITGTSLDPQDWTDFRALAHRMLDETIDRIANVRARPVWQPIPDEVRAAVRADVPRKATDLAEVYREFSEHVAPY